MLTGWLIRADKMRSEVKLSYVHGQGSQPLIGVTIGRLLEQTTDKHPDKEAIVVCHQTVRLTFQQLLHQAFSSYIAHSVTFSSSFTRHLSYIAISVTFSSSFTRHLALTLLIQSLSAAPLPGI
jgi:hypothetical protein